MVTSTSGESFAERARQFTLASVLSSYPDDELGIILGGLGDGVADHPGAAGLAAAMSGPEGLDDVRSAYLNLFDRGREGASLYETEYGRMRGMSKGNDLADIGGFYQAFGLTIDGERVHEMLDHIAVELEFYSVLLVKEQALASLGDAEGIEIVGDARKKFLVEHLGRLARAISERQDVRVHPVYGGVFAWCWELVARECALAGVDPPLLDYFGDDELKSEMACGAVHLPVLQ